MQFGLKCTVFLSRIAYAYEIYWQVTKIRHVNIKTAKKSLLLNEIYKLQFCFSDGDNDQSENDSKEEAQNEIEKNTENANDDDSKEQNEDDADSKEQEAQDNDDEDSKEQDKPDEDSKEQQDDDSKEQQQQDDDSKEEQKQDEDSKEGDNDNDDDDDDDDGSKEDSEKTITKRQAAEVNEIITKTYAVEELLLVRILRKHFQQ